MEVVPSDTVRNVRANAGILAAVSGTDRRDHRIRPRAHQVGGQYGKDPDGPRDRFLGVGPRGGIPCGLISGELSRSRLVERMDLEVRF